MGLAAIIGGVSAIGGIASSVIGAGAAGDAANAQVQAAQQAAQTQLQMYNQTRQDLLPFQQTGTAANAQLARLYGIGVGPNGSNTAPNTALMTSALEQTPGYQFTLSQGQQALDRSAASRGLLLSGGQIKDSLAYGQGLGLTNAFNPYITELNALATAGQNSAAKTGELGAGYAGNIGSAQLAVGTARANGDLAGASALQGGIAQGGGLLQTLYGSSYGDPGAAAAYGRSGGAISEPLDPFGFGGGGTDYSGLFNYGS